MATEELSPPREPSCKQEVRDGQRLARLAWHTAYAGDEPIREYEIWRDNQKVTQVEHRPQTGKAPFDFQDHLNDTVAHTYRIVTLDAIGRTATTEELMIPTTG